MKCIAWRIHSSKRIRFTFLYKRLCRDRGSETSEVHTALKLIFQNLLSKFQRRRRDLNPRAAINDLLTFQASPFSHLGTSPSVDIMDSWWTERVGFEPTRPCGQTVFKTASLWPLRYLSITYSVVVVLCVSRDDLFIIPNQNTYVNTFFKVFLFFLFFLSKSLFIGLHL